MEIRKIEYKNISEKIKLIDKSIEHSTIFWIIPECEFFLKTKYLPYITTYYLINLNEIKWNKIKWNLMKLTFILLKIFY